MVADIALLDLGAQYKYLIKGALEECGAKVDVLEPDTPADELRSYKGIVLSGGPKSVTEPGAPSCDPTIWNLPIPKWGICYGMQLATRDLGGKVGPLSAKEYGEIEITVEQDNPLLEGIEAEVQRVLMSHGDSLIELAPGMERVAYTTNILTGEEIPAIVYDHERQVFGTQFHPEITKITEHGKTMFANFLRICGIKPAKVEAGEMVWDSKAELEESLTYIRETAGNKLVITGVSGGVDSTMAVKMLRMVLPDEQLRLVHFDTGLNRKDESEEAVRDLTEYFGIPVEYYDIAEQTFKSVGKVERDVFEPGKGWLRKGEPTPPLEECLHPQVKRWAFKGVYTRAFIDLIEREGLTEEDAFVGQGTLHTDKVESGETGKGGETDTIKSHHNRIPLPEIEPNGRWHKHELRRVGEYIKLAPEFLWRPPFPGPGLSVRVICSDGENLLRMTEQDMALYGQLGEKASQIAAHFDMDVQMSPIRSVGVAGDARDFSYMAILMPNKNWLDMDADDWRKAKQAANNIPMYAYARDGDVQEGISRVLLSARELQPMDLMMLTKTFVTPETIAQLQESDAIVREATERMDLDRKIAQFPVSTLPLGCGFLGCRSTSLRPFDTEHWMAGRAALPGEIIPLEFLEEVLPKLERVNGITNVFFDLSSKPKGTTELE